MPRFRVCQRQYAKKTKPILQNKKAPLAGGFFVLPTVGQTVNQLEIFDCTQYSIYF